MSKYLIVIFYMLYDNDCYDSQLKIININFISFFSSKIIFQRHYPGGCDLPNYSQALREECEYLGYNMAVILNRFALKLSFSLGSPLRA